MNKRLPLILASLVMLAAAITLLVPRWIGSQVQASIATNMSGLMTDNLRRQIDLRELDYQRGWFQSTARYELTYRPMGLSEGLPMEFDLAIAHGPLFPARDSWQLGLAGVSISPVLDNKEVQKALMELPFTPPALQLHLLVGLDQSLDFQLSVAPARADTREGSFRFDGLNGRLRAEADLSARGSLEMGQLTASSADNGDNFTLHSLRVTTETEQINDLLAPSMAMLVIPAISATGSSNFSVDGISINSRLEQYGTAADRLNMSQEVLIDSIDSTLPVSSLHWQFSLNRLPVELLRNYTDLVNQVQTQVGANGIPDNQMMRLGQDLGMQLLTSDFALSSELRGNAYDGDHRADLQINYAGVPDAQDFNAMNPRELLAAIDLDLDVDLDLEAALRSPYANMIDPWVQEGYIRIDSGRIRVDARLRDSQLVLNGETIALEQWFAE